MSWGCVFSKPQEDGHGVQRKVLLEQHLQLINNNNSIPGPRWGWRSVVRRSWEEVTEMVTLRQTAAMCPKELGEELLFRYI